MGKTFSSIGSAFESVGNYIANPTNITRIFTDPGSVVNDAFNGIQSFTRDVGQAIESDAEEVGRTIAEVAEEIGEGLDEAFSKDGVFTRFVEENVPGGGFFTAIAHAAAGNEEHAQVAALKGLSTAVEAGLAVAGAAMGGPLGGALGGALGAASRNLFDGAMHELVPETMQHRFKELSVEDLIVDVSIGAAMGAVSGARNTAKATENVLKAAAKEGVEDLSGDALKAAVAREMTKQALTNQMTKGVAKDALKEAGEAIVSELEIPQFTKLEALELITKQAFENRVMEEYRQQNGGGQSTSGFIAAYDENLGEYWIRDGIVVWSAAEARIFELHSLAVDKGFESVGAYQAELVRSYAIAHENAQQSGSSDGEWIIRDNDILGPFMVKDGQIVFGATTPEEAEAGLVRQELDRLGFDSVEDFRDVFERSQLRASQEGFGAGQQGEWVQGTNALLGDYMMRDGKVVWGATTTDEAEDGLIQAELDGMGFATVDLLKEEFIRSYRISHEMDVEADRNPMHPEWTAATHRVLGDYFIREGEIVWGATSAEEAAELYTNQFELVPTPAEPSPPVDPDPHRTDPSEIDWSTMTRAEVEALWAREDEAEAIRLAELEETNAEPEVDLSTMTREEIEAMWAEQDALLTETEPDGEPEVLVYVVDQPDDGTPFDLQIRPIDNGAEGATGDADDWDRPVPTGAEADRRGLIDTDGDGVPDAAILIVEHADEAHHDDPLGIRSPTSTNQQPPAPDGPRESESSGIPDVQYEQPAASQVEPFTTEHTVPEDVLTATDELMEFENNFEPPPEENGDDMSGMGGGLGYSN